MPKLSQAFKDIVKHKVITMVDRKELEFLDKLGRDSLFSTGHKLSYNQILKALIDFAMEAGIKGENITSPNALKDEVRQKSANLHQR